jgi:hypothetical protein
VTGPGRHADNAAVTAAVGLPVCEALLAFDRGEARCLSSERQAIRPDSPITHAS